MFSKPICILLSSVECQYKAVSVMERQGGGLDSISLFRVRIENGKHYLKGHPISSSRWIGKKAPASTNNLIEFSLPFL